MNEVLFSLLIQAVVAIFGLAGIIGAVYLKKKMNREELTQKMMLAEIVVKYAEQLYKDFDGEKKFEKAAEYMSSFAKERGLKISNAEIKVLIESSLKSMKKEFNREISK